ncbi:MAG TPA: copper-binding protein [Thermoanaerobaculia bacterium]|nr:copper-binding protein [Thermoanaerobaculia bacterium]
MRAALAVVLLAVAAAGCRAEPLPEQRPAPADATYTVRGEVSQLPQPESPGHEIFVFHEAVPEFVSREGEEVGMDSMAMGFTVPRDLPLEGIERGDKVEMTFEIRWEAEPTLLVTEIHELPADTELRLGERAQLPVPAVPAPAVEQPELAEPAGEGAEGADGPK